MTESFDHFEDLKTEESLSALGATLQAHRDQSKEFLAAQQGRLAELEQTLVSELTQICGSLEEWQSTYQEIETWQIEVGQQQQATQAAAVEVDELRLKTQQQRRSLAEKFAERRHRNVEASSGTISQLEERIAELQNQLEEVDSTDLESQIQSLQQQLEAEQSQQTRLATELKSAQDELNASRKDAGTLEEQATRNRELVEERDQKIKSLRGELDQVSEKSSKTISHLEERVKLLLQQLEEVEQEDLGTQLQEVTEQLAEEQSRNKQLASDAKAAQESLAQAQQEVETLGQEATQGRECVEERDAQIASLRSELEQVNQESSQHLTELTEQVQTLQQQLEQTDQDDHESKLQLLSEQLSEEQSRNKRLTEDARSARDELLEVKNESGTLRQQLARGRELLDERNQQIKSLRGEVDQLAEGASEDTQGLHRELDRLRSEADALRTQVSELEQANRTGEPDEELEDLRSKYEMAVDNVRAMKERNEELERELAAQNTGEGDFCWEAKKRELMQSLGDGAPADAPPEEISARQQLENTVKMSDKIIAQKDQEIADLQARFEAIESERAESNQADVEAPASAAPAEEDTLTVQSREELETLKNEWKEKLRAAEVDISVERAQNARVRAELEEKKRDLEAQLALAKKQTAMRTQDKPKRWFGR